MANEWTDSSFELGLAGLTLAGSAAVLDSPGYWPDGTKGLVLQCSAPPPLGGSGNYSTARRTLTTTPGETYAVSAQIALALDGSPRAPLVVEARTVGGTVLATYSTTTGAAPFALWSPGSFVATEAQTVVEWRAELPASGGAAWAVDLVSVSEEDADMERVNQISAAINARLATITTGNGYPWTIAAHDDFVSPGVASYPNSQTIRMGDEKEIKTLARKYGRALFDVLLFDQSTGSLDVLYEMAAVVETVLETPVAGQLLGLAGVNEVQVVGRDPLPTEEAIHQGVRKVAVHVVVDFQHARYVP